MRKAVPTINLQVQERRTPTMPALVASPMATELRRRFDEDEDEFEDGYSFEDEEDDDAEGEFDDDEDELAEEDDDLEEEFEDDFEIEEEPEER